ncbi:DDX55 helicase, partial [Crypturellus undulatus]|nr:DDX55 helicase [Crypturellus undulatus]
STCACVEYYGKALESLIKQVKIMCIHGKMKHKRNKIFTEFRKLPGGILVCTDVMARGVDIPEVHWVLQYDPPSSASAFVHRCGRTARIGNVGSALVFLLPMEESYVNFLSINQK